MFATFRLAMTWIHTWCGLVAGYVLMVIFFFGTLSVFAREIDRWTIPETRFAAQPMPSWDRVLAPAFARIEPTAEAMAALAKSHPGAGTPTLRLDGAGAFRTHRDRTVSLYPDFVAEYADGSRASVEGPETEIDARTGERIAANAFPIGTKLFYPMHIHLHLADYLSIGYWLVGLAAMGMLVALVSGVVIHRRLFAELFTFRPWKGGQRATLDLHNFTGVLAMLLPASLEGRVRWQVGALLGVWLLSFIHAAARGGVEGHAAWREQCWAVTVLAFGAMTANALTTGDHLVKTLVTERYLPVACVDLALVVTGLVAWRVASRLGRAATRPAPEGRAR